MRHKQKGFSVLWAVLLALALLGTLTAIFSGSSLTLATEGGRLRAKSLAEAVNDQALQYRAAYARQRHGRLTPIAFTSDPGGFFDPAAGEARDAAVPAGAEHPGRSAWRWNLSVRFDAPHAGRPAAAAAVTPEVCDHLNRIAFGINAAPAGGWNAAVATLTTAAVLATPTLPSAAATDVLISIGAGLTGQPTTVCVTPAAPDAVLGSQFAIAILG